jgi:hypothetical protein
MAGKRAVLRIRSGTIRGMENLSSEIAELARHGLSLPQIAERLGVSESQIAAVLDSRDEPASDDRRSPDETSADSFPASDPPAGPAAP